MDVTNATETMRRRSGNQSEDDSKSLAIFRSGLVTPGERWGEYSSSFERDEADISTLGRLAASVACELNDDFDNFTFGRTIEQFAVAAQPSIQDQDLQIFKGAALRIFAEKQAAELPGGTQ